MEGLIPARAGNTSQQKKTVTNFRAHPRSRGEHGPIIDPEKSSAGSSPLARGTPANKWLVVAPHGLIPARAGNTSGLNAAFKELGAHPRSRGEHTTVWAYASGASGSSPLARGTLKHAADIAPEKGLIPARAGNTRMSGPPG